MCQREELGFMIRTNYSSEGYSYKFEYHPTSKKMFFLITSWNRNHIILPREWQLTPCAQWGKLYNISDTPKNKFIFLREIWSCLRADGSPTIFYTTYPCCNIVSIVTLWRWQLVFCKGKREVLYRTKPSNGIMKGVTFVYIGHGDIRLHVFTRSEQAGTYVPTKGGTTT